MASYYCTKKQNIQSAVVLAEAELSLAPSFSHVLQEVTREVIQGDGNDNNEQH